MKWRRDLILHSAETVTGRWGILGVRGGHAYACAHVYRYVYEAELRRNPAHLETGR